MSRCSGGLRGVCTLGLLCGLLLAGVMPAAGEAAEKLPPRHEFTNVILISVDILRADHLGAYGYGRETSPRIDGLARQAVLFENAIAHSYLTPVAQMSVFTGQYPRRHGMVSFEVGQGEVNRRTLPEILSYYGYVTAAVVSSPEFFMRYDTASGTIVNPKDIFSRSFGYFGRTMPDATGSVRVNPTGAIDWLRSNRDKKFFLWVETGMLHPPYSQTVPLPLKTRFDPPGYTPFYERLPIRPGRPAEDRGVPTEVLFHLFKGSYYLDFEPVHQLTAEDVAFIRGRYDAGIVYTDQFVGDLLRTLDELQLAGRTLVVFHSIHGENLGEHGYFFHHDVFDPEVKTALLFRLPGNQRGGSRVNRQVQGIDILPTILDYLQIPIHHEVQGASLLPLLEGREKDYLGGEYAYIDRLPWWEYVLGGWHLEHQAERAAQYTPLESRRIEQYRTRLQQTIGKEEHPPQCLAIRTNRWKLIYRPRRELLEELTWWHFIAGQSFPVPEVELFDLAVDPREQTNVAAAHPRVVAELKARLLAWDAENERLRPRGRKDGGRLLIPYP